MARNHTLRIMENNLAALMETTYITKSSEVTAFPFTNSRLDMRAKYWKPQGHFLIDSTNNSIYINDGSDKTVTLTSASYTSPASMASHVQTRLNASSSGWTVAYSTTTNKFTISKSGSATLRLSQTANAAWSTLGYTTSTDLTGTSFAADQQRNHTSEYVLWDFIGPRECTFFACIGPAFENFTVSSGATLKLYANNVNDWASPPFEVTLTRTDNGIFRALDDQAEYSYRYWKFEIIDKFNTLGPEGLKLSHIYLGDHVTFEDRPIAYGYEKGWVDPSRQSSAESGTPYFDVKKKYRTFSGLALNWLKRADKDALELLYKLKGKTEPFYISIDPTLLYTDSLDELSAFAYFMEEPRFSHTARDFFSTSLSFREAI